MFRTLILTTAAALALTAGAANAQSANSASVSAKGLDLQSEAGAKVYYDRLKSAVAQVCGGGQSYFMPSEQDRIDACEKATLADAVAATHAPMVTALFKNLPDQTRFASK